MLMALGEMPAPGVLLGSGAGNETEGQEYEEPEPVAEQRIERFRSTVSPTAFQLAAYLATAPLMLPVMRLVQQAMLPDSHPSHLAEVLLGGLMRRVTPEDTRLPDEEIAYEFHEGVRERLLSSILKTEAIQVLRIVASVVERQIGRPIDFPALFPDENGRYQLPEGAIPFAKVGAQVLERLGVKPPQTTGKGERTSSRLEGWRERSTELEAQARALELMAQLESLYKAQDWSGLQALLGEIRGPMLSEEQRQRLAYLEAETDAYVAWKKEFRHAIQGLEGFTPREHSSQVKQFVVLSRGRIILFFTR
jgi:hypothetical protein